MCLNFFFSFKQIIFDANKFGSLKMSWKYNFKGRVFKYCMTINFYDNFFLIILYCAVIFRHCIFSYTKVFIWKFLCDNGERKYKCSLNWTQDNSVYVKPCFIRPFGLSARWSRVKPCAWWIMSIVVNWIGNCIFVMIWKGLLPICISQKNYFVGVHFLPIVRNCL
jgi:hypothetical protein